MINGDQACSTVLRRRIGRAWAGWIRCFAAAEFAIERGSGDAQLRERCFPLGLFLLQAKTAAVDLDALSFIELKVPSEALVFHPQREPHQG